MSIDDNKDLIDYMGLDDIKTKKKKLNLTSKIKFFSMQYLAHHPVCNKFENHVFKIGSLFLCVGCTSVLTAFIIYTILFFSIPSTFQSFPLINALVALAGVSMSVIQVLLKTKNKWVKAIFRFCLGAALGAYTGIIVLIDNIGLKIGLFAFLFPGVYLYNILRGQSSYLECRTCETKFLEHTCDYNVLSSDDR